MINNICFRASQWTNHSFFQEMVTIFQEKTLKQVIQPTLGDHLVEIAKVIGALATIIFSIIIVTGGIYWLFFKENVQEVDVDETSLNEFQSPLISSKQSDIKDDFLSPQVSNEPSKIQKVDEKSKLHSFHLKYRDQYKNNFLTAFHLIFQIDKGLEYLCSFQRQLPSQALLNEIHQLEPFGDQNFKEYEAIAIQLEKLLDPYDMIFYQFYYPYHKSPSDPICKTILDVHDKHLDFIFGGIAEQYFNRDEIEQSLIYCKKIKYNSKIKSAIFSAIINRYINQTALSEAFGFLKEMPYGDERDQLYGRIAKIYFKAKDYPIALETAKNMSYSKEKEAFILEIAKVYFSANNLKEALNATKGLSYSEEKESWILKIAKTYYRKGKVQKALAITKSLTYSEKRDRLIQQMQQGLSI